MSAVSVSVVVPHGPGDQRPIEEFLETTGLTFEVLAPRDASYGDAIRTAVAEARGSAIVIADGRCPYPVAAIGDAAALIESGAADVVFGATSDRRSGSRVLRWLLGSLLPDPSIRLVALSSVAASLVVGESRLRDADVELEIAFLANKYGFRIDSLHVTQAQQRARSFGVAAGIGAALRIRLANRRNAYRAARRCPVCFSAEVWSCAQIPGNVVRACRRCKCRYLNQFTDEQGGGLPVRRVLRGHVPASPGYELHAPPAREKTSLRRYQWLHRQVPAKARILEVGVRDGGFGAITSREYEYVGIDPASAAARHARSRGLEVYCASLSSFVNTGPAFDAVTLFHVFENMPDPHDALGRIKELLKPGGFLLLSAFDTEGLIYLMSEKRRMAENFRTHLILYSRSALIELLEHSGFEIIDIGPDFEYRDHKFIRHRLAHAPMLAAVARLALRVLPDPAIVSTGSIRIVARRRSGQGPSARAIRSVEPTHAR